MGTTLQSPKGGGDPQNFGLCLLRPNGWMDELVLGTEVGLSPSDCVRWGCSPPPQKGGCLPSPIFGLFCCGQTAGYIKMPLGMDVGLSPEDFVLDGDTVPPLQQGAEPPNFRPMFIVAKRLDGSRCHSVSYTHLTLPTNREV